MLGVSQQVVAERRAGAEHGQQPHRRALVVDQRRAAASGRRAGRRELCEVGESQRLVGVGDGREQVDQLVGVLAEPLERGGGRRRRRTRAARAGPRWPATRLSPVTLPTRRRLRLGDCGEAAAPAGARWHAASAARANVAEVALDVDPARPRVAVEPATTG